MSVVYLLELEIGKRVLGNIVPCNILGYKSCIVFSNNELDIETIFQAQRSAFISKENMTFLKKIKVDLGLILTWF